MMKPMKSLVAAGLILGVLAGTCEAQPTPYNPSESLERKIERGKMIINKAYKKVWTSAAEIR